MAGDLDAEPLRTIIRDRLLRRLSASKRIGCPYRLALKRSRGHRRPVLVAADIMAQFA